MFFTYSRGIMIYREASCVCLSVHLFLKKLASKFLPCLGKMPPAYWVTLVINRFSQGILASIYISC